MKKNIIILCVTTTFALANSLPNYLSETRPGAYLDLGIQGKTYEIVEEDLLHKLEKEASSFKLDPEETRKKIEEQVALAAKKDTKLPLCEKDIILEPVQDLFEVPVDMPNPFGRKILSKGQKIASKLPAGRSLDLCFIDARVKEVGINQINSLSKNNPQCLFLVANADVRDFRKIFPNLQIFPTSEHQESRFNLKCYPAKIHFESDTKQETYFNYEQFKTQG